MESPVLVVCPYCDFIFEHFTCEIFRDHLQSIHNIHKSLDILVEFSFKAINKGICEIILKIYELSALANFGESAKNDLWILFLFFPETDESCLDCVSPEPLAPAAPVALPENTSNIESEDELEEEETKSEDPINEEKTVPKDADAVVHQPSKPDDEEKEINTSEGNLDSQNTTEGNNCHDSESGDVVVKPSTENVPKDKIDDEAVTKVKEGMFKIIFT